MSCVYASFISWLNKDLNCKKKLIASGLQTLLLRCSTLKMSTLLSLGIRYFSILCFKTVCIVPFALSSTVFSFDLVSLF